MIVVPDDFPTVFEGSEAHERARALGDVRVFKERGAEDEAELARRIGASAVAVNIRAYSRFSDAVFARCPDLKLVAIWGTGTDNIDLAAAARRGVTICNTPGVNAIAVAEHAMALMLAVARSIPRIDREMRAGAWPRDMVSQMHGKTLGIFGTGAIGQRVAHLGRALGMNVRTWSARHGTPAQKREILECADFVSLHLRLVPETRGFIDAAAFSRMKRGAVLVNTGRGALVDRAALHAALTDGTLGGAGLDVFHDEPLPPGDPLTRLPNTVLSPHNAGQTPEVRRDGLNKVIDNVAAFLAGRPANVVAAV